jgi:hypothetical protein
MPRTTVTFFSIHMLFFIAFYIEIIRALNPVADCMTWFKFDKCIMPNNKNVYMCAIYMPPDKNVYYMYRKYNIDVFDVLQEHIEHFSALGTVSIIGGTTIFILKSKFTTVHTKSTVTYS